jgi:hypothetical protein
VSGFVLRTNTKIIRIIIMTKIDAIKAACVYVSGTCGAAVAVGVVDGDSEAVGVEADSVGVVGGEEGDCRVCVAWN